MTSENQSLAETKETPSLSGATEETSVIPVPQEADEHVSLVKLAARLPLQLDLRVPLPSFRVQNLLSLEKGQVIESAWPHSEDLPLWSGDVHLVWTEFEVIDQKLAVRVTRLV